jgi:hypothetical protein
MSRTHIQEFLSMRRNIIPAKLKLKGKVGWDSTIPQMASTGNGDNAPQAPEYAACSNVPRNIAFFECPICQKVEPSTCAAFQHIDLDKKQLCTACLRQSAVKLWKCNCGKAWHICHVHKHMPLPQNTHATMLPSIGQPSASANRLKRKRKQPPSYLLSYAEMLAEDLRKTQLKEERDVQGIQHRVISLGNCKHGPIRSNFLSPNLKRRFMGDLSSRSRD